VYQKLRLDAEILERIVPLVIKERYLHGQEYVLTEQSAQAGLRTPGEARVVSREAWEEGIAEGMQHGLFGLGGLEDGQPMCRDFKERPLVGLSGSGIIIQADICQTQHEENKRPTVYHSTSDAGGLPVKDAGDQCAGGTPGATGGQVKEPKKTRPDLNLNSLCLV
jgi:hypothetical protein